MGLFTIAADKIGSSFSTSLGLLIFISGISVPLLWFLADYVRILRLRQRMPPGPFPLPLFGNFFDIPNEKPWIKWEQMAKEYDNPMLTLWNGRRPIIVCNDIWTISDLLDKRASIYSSRPHFVVMGDMMNMTETNQVNQLYGDRWRLHRRLTHGIVGSQAVRAHRHLQLNESKVLTRDLMESPETFEPSIERYSCSVVSIIGWGRRIAKINDPVGQVALSFMEAVDYVMPGLFIMEAVPFLSKLPAWIYPLPSQILTGAKIFQRYFAALSREASQAREDNFSKQLMAAQEMHGLTDDDVASLTANLIGGGVDTTSSSILSFILAMCVFPEAQRKAQEEIEAVVGSQRTPTWDDEDRLPFVKAVVSETLRWRTVTILGGIPHAPTQDDEYNGYFIPKGTAITGNLWAIHRNPRDFPDPDTFRPERFLGGLERPYPNKKGHNAFGWGRRQCSGQPLAEQGLFITIARLLWAFSIKPGLDKQGNEVKLDIFAYTKSENTRPQPFKAQFIPRTPEIAEILRSEADTALEELSVFDGETKITMASVM
ncbi:cytochrome P450 [Ilyonectria destructans]|nr:cytochrome P450 [Ilyonectria destructans]